MTGLLLLDVKWCKLSCNNHRGPLSGPAQPRINYRPAHQQNPRQREDTHHAPRRKTDGESLIDTRAHAHTRVHTLTVRFNRDTWRCKRSVQKLARVFQSVTARRWKSRGSNTSSSHLLHPERLQHLDSREENVSQWCSNHVYPAYRLGPVSVTRPQGCI